MKRREQGHIEKRGPNRHLIRWRIKDDSTGKTRQVSEVIRGDYGAAMTALANKLHGTSAGSADEPAPRTFGSYIENEWGQYQSDKWKPSTQVTQGSSVRRHIIPHFEGMSLSGITPTKIVEFHRAMEAKGLSRKTRRNLHAILAKMFAFARVEPYFRQSGQEGNCSEAGGEDRKTVADGGTSVCALRCVAGSH